MKLIHLTDTHLTARKSSIAGLNPYENFRICLSHIMRNNRDADRIVITGDLAHKGHIDSYLQLKECLHQIPIPTDLVIGNHDNRENFYSVFPQAHQDENGFVQGVTETPAGLFVFLDTVHDGKYGSQKTHAGFFDQARFDWLTLQLEKAKSTDQKVCIFMHHHPRNVLVKPCDAIGFHQQQEFRKIVSQYRDQLRYIFFGHCHMTLSGTFSGVPFSSLRGTNHQVIPDFSQDEKFKMAALNPAYNVVFFEKDDVVIHSIDYAYEGEYEEIGTTWSEWVETG